MKTRCRTIGFEFLVLEEKVDKRWIRLASIRQGWLSTPRGACLYPQQMEKFLRYWRRERNK